MTTCLEQKTVVTIKPHNCWGCASNFPKKTRMEIITNIVDGKFTRSYWCNNCAEFYKRMEDKGDGIFYGEFKGEEEYNKFVKENDIPR